MSGLIPVVWIDNLRGNWDHGLLLNFIQGDLYAVPWAFQFEHVLEKEATWAWDRGGVVVVSGPMPKREEQIAAVVARMPWAVVHFLSDEEARFPYGIIEQSARKLVWLQCPWQGRSDMAARHRRWSTGLHNDTRERLRRLRQPERDLTWSFVGQATHAHRYACVEALKGLQDLPHILDVTGGFGQGRDYDDYLQVLRRSKIVACPSGAFVADAFRLSETLEAGALPIAEQRGPAGPHANYWDELFPDRPFISVADWSSAPGIIRDYHENPLVLLQHTNRASAWWVGQKRTWSYALTNDIADVSCVVPQPRSSVANRVTVLMPTSPIPDHPSTATIENAIGRVRSYPALAHCEIIIMVDGVREEQADRVADYEEYKRRLIELCNRDPRFTGCLPLVFDQHTHQVEMTKRALGMLNTKYLFFVEHDTYPMGEIPFDTIVDAMDEAGDYLPVVRFHIFSEVLEEHRPLYHEREVIAGVPLIRTRQWSQRPHLARAEWYAKVLDEFIDPGDRTMIEDAIHGPVEEASWDRFRIRIYAPEGDILRSGTTNGRKADPKFPMYWKGRWR